NVHPTGTTRGQRESCLSRSAGRRRTPWSSVVPAHRSRSLTRAVFGNQRLSRPARFRGRGSRGGINPVIVPCLNNRTEAVGSDFERDVQDRKSTRLNSSHDQI